MKNPALLIVSILFLCQTSSTAGDEIGFIETFALAKNREEALKQLIPGTEDFYYFHALHAQNQGKLDEVDGYLEPWIKRHGETKLQWEIRNRQALLRYGKDPKGSLEYLRKRMGLQFDQQQKRLNARPDFPTHLDPALVSWEAFQREAFRSSNTLNQVSDAGLDAIIRGNVKLDDRRRRELLSRLKYPDYERLVGLIAADLRTKESRGFGEFSIHRNLLPEQLAELLRINPPLINNSHFVNTWISKLRPGADVDWQHNSAEREAYLNRVWNFAKTLQPSFNSLKAHVLYQLLLHHEKKGEYPRELFTNYLQLPRFLPYVSPKFLSDPTRRQFRVDLNADFRAVTACSSIRNDEPLVRDYLLHFFLTDPSRESFAPYIRDTYLKPLFAEAKLTNGIGDAQKWYSLLSPTALQSLKDRVDIAFPQTNPEHFSASQAVSLDVFVKNVNQLMVKVYEINTLNYFLSEKRDLNTDLNLDGLIANEEKIYRYEEAPLHRVKRRFSFDSMKGKRGAWVVEFIGNGMSSRALIRKGKLQYISHPTAAGSILTVLNEENGKAKDPAVWFGGKCYTPNQQGTILLPFSVGGEHPIVLTDGDFASFEQLTLPVEKYHLAAGFHIERETLLPGTEARLAVRPDFRVGNQPASVSLLKDVVLSITTTDLNGISSVNQVADFKLFDNLESIYKFRVPARLRNLSVSLRAKAESISRGGEKMELGDQTRFDLNGIDETPQVADCHLSRMGGNYLLEIFGKTGEPVADRAVHFQIQHRDFKRQLHFNLKTDERGRIQLGKLDGIQSIETSSDGMLSRNWTLSRDQHSYPDSIHAAMGDPVRIPAPLVTGKLSPADVAVFEKRSGTFVKNNFSQCSFGSGIIQIEGLAPGDYELRLRHADATINLRVTNASSTLSGYALSRARHLQMVNPAPLQIASLTAGDKELQVHLINADDRTRVHVVATRFLPEYPIFDTLSSTGLTEPSIISRGTSDSLYISGRDIGDEYRYILARHAARKFPGNMLKHPALLLNPWALQKTETSIDDAKQGEKYKRSQESKKSKRTTNSATPSEKDGLAPHREPSQNLDFLARQAVAFYDLKPDANGLISIKIADLGDRQHIHVLAVNANNAAYRQISLNEKGRETLFRDRRLQEHLDLKKHFIQQRSATLLRTGESLSIADHRASELETYDTLSSVFTTLSGIHPDKTFSEFGFILTWPTLKPDKKRQIYSKYASHELNFFLSRHDPDFFKTVIQPYLRNKRDKTFFDDYLIGNDLTKYTRPWNFSRLNIVERILLARRLGKTEPAATARHVRELFDLIPVNVERNSHLFRSALRGRRSLDEANEWNVAGAVAGVAFNAPQPAMAVSGPGRPKLGALRKSGADKESADSYSAAPAKVPAPVAADMAESAVALQRYSKSPPSGNMASGANEAADRLLTGDELRQLRRQAASQSLFRKLEATREWAENNYYHRPIAEQVASLVTVNAFWRDFADWDGKGGFYSSHFPAASHSFAEMMLALSVLDLPFKAEKQNFIMKDHSLTLTAKSPVLVFHEEIQEAPEAKNKTSVLVSQNFFRNDDRYTDVNNERADKFVTDEFLTGVLYGCQVVVTNPTSSSQKLDLLLQIPQGAIPANGSVFTKTQHVHLNPFSTQKVETYFYFPDDSGDGVFGHYPVQVAADEKLIAWAEPFDFKVVNKLSKIDKASWEYLSQFGTEKDVTNYLNEHNIQRIDLSRIAWRMRDKVDFFRRTVALLKKRHRYDASLWSYGIYHNDTAVAREYLTHREDFLRQCGEWIDCELVSIDPVDRHWIQYLEYSPLVNARSHRLGRDRKILNQRFRSQYQSTLKVLSYRSEFDDNDDLTVATYLFLQDRIEEGLDWLGRVKNPDKVETKLQSDYLRAYASLYQEKPKLAAQIAARYADYPVDRWRSRFAQVTEQVREIRGAEGNMTDDRDRSQQQENLSARSPFLELTTEGHTAKLLYRNLKAVTVNYYEMDLEFLFSNKPFASGDSGQFSFIKPNFSEEKQLPADQDLLKFPIPKQFSSKNVLVEVVGGGQTKSSAVYANSLKVQIYENYGQMQVRGEKQGKAKSKVYVKVYARNKDGSVKFFKDGYTDLRGKFDYVSLNTNELENVQKLSLLIMSEDDGSLVREVEPPQR